MGSNLTFENKYYVKHTGGDNLGSAKGLGHEQVVQIKLGGVFATNDGQFSQESSASNWQ